MITVGCQNVKLPQATFVTRAAARPSKTLSAKKVVFLWYGRPMVAPTRNFNIHRRGDSRIARFFDTRTGKSVPFIFVSAFLKGVRGDCNISLAKYFRSNGTLRCFSLTKKVSPAISFKPNTQKGKTKLVFPFCLHLSEALIGNYFITRKYMIKSVWDRRRIILHNQRFLSRESDSA